MPGPRKRKARKIREGKGVTYVGDDGKLYNNPQHEGHRGSTHLMATADKSVFPTISPTGKGGAYELQTPEQAYQRGEMFEFKKQRKADRFAFGSWKKGKEKREAMKSYRKYRKEQRKNE
jgi:hypothetical protein